jgi:acyl carrier protein
VARADEVRRAVAGHLRVDPGRLTPSATLAGDLGLDPLARLELVTVLEDRFALRIADEEWAALRTYGELADLVLHKVAG